jgi:hypothetical protein
MKLNWKIIRHLIQMAEVAPRLELCFSKSHAAELCRHILFLGEANLVVVTDSSHPDLVSIDDITTQGRAFLMLTREGAVLTRALKEISEEGDWVEIESLQLVTEATTWCFEPK